MLGIKFAQYKCAKIDVIKLSSMNGKRVNFQEAKGKQKLKGNKIKSCTKIDRHGYYKSAKIIGERNSVFKNKTLYSF